MIEPVNLRWQDDQVRDAVREALRRVEARGVYVLGPEVAAFETAWAAYVGAAHCVGVGNGLDALRLALIVSDVHPGSGVIVPAHTYVATWMAVTLAGGRPMPVDVDPSTYNLEANLLTGDDAESTRAILAVHMYGNPCDTEELAAMASTRGWILIEDGAQAHGALLGERRVGGHGRVVAWSFYPTKNLGARGDAGAVTTDDPDQAELLRQLRDYGRSSRDRHERVGLNSRLDELQAAVLLAKLPWLDRWNERRRQIASRYTAAFEGSYVIPPASKPRTQPVWHQYVVRVPNREAFRASLESHGIRTLVHYPVPPHRQPAYSSFRESDYLVADDLARSVVSLPIGPHLSDSDVDRVIEVALAEVPARA